MASELVKSYAGASTPVTQEAQRAMLTHLTKYQAQLSKILPKNLSPERFQWLIWDQIRRNPNIAKVTPVSFVNAVLLASQIGVEIRDKSAYIIPFGSEATLLVDYRAKLDIAARAGVTIRPAIVYQRDFFEFAETINGTHLIHKPAVIQGEQGDLKPAEDRGRPVAAYAIAEFGGSRIVHLMSLKEIERRRLRSRNPGNHTGAWDPEARRKVKGPALTFEEIMVLHETGDVDHLAFKDDRRVPWVTDWHKMALKTVVHDVVNYCPSTPSANPEIAAKLALAQQVDEAAESETAPKAIAQGMDQILLLTDPEDDKPLVDGGGETREEQKAAQEAVKQRKLAAVDEKRIRQTITDLAQQEQPQ